MLNTSKYKYNSKVQNSPSHGWPFLFHFELIIKSSIFFQPSYKETCTKVSHIKSDLLMQALSYPKAYHIRS